MATNNEIIFTFIETWGTRNIDKIMSYFNSDAIYTNIPIDPPSSGLDEIRATINGFVNMASEIEFIVHHQAEAPTGAIMNERLDRFLINDKWVEIPVMGIFELNNGKISEWRDYFDMAQFSEQM